MKFHSWIYWNTTFSYVEFHPWIYWNTTFLMWNFVPEFTEMLLPKFTEILPFLMWNSIPEFTKTLLSLMWNFIPEFTEILLSLMLNFVSVCVTGSLATHRVALHWNSTVLMLSQSAITAHSGVLDSDARGKGEKHAAMKRVAVRSMGCPPS